MFKRIICITLSLIMIFSLTVFEPTSIVSAVTQQELEDKIDELDGKISANKKKLDELKNKKEKKLDYLKTLENQIDNVESKVANLQDQIDNIDTQVKKLDKELDELAKEILEINAEIIQAQNDIQALETNISSTSSQLAAKLRSAYMNGEESALQIFMGADSLASFMTRLEFMKRTSERDKQVINGFRDKIKKLNSTKDKLEKDKVKVNEKVVKLNEKKALSLEKKTTLQKKRKDYDSTMSDLEKKYGEVEDVVASLDKSSKNYKNYISDLEKEKAAADAEIDRIIQEYYNSQNKNNSSNSSSSPTYDASGSWLWPVGNISCYISSPYGYRSGRLHGAIDIAGGGISGKPVYATKGGKVITSTYGSGSYWSYGNYILIDHGGGYISLYAHLSSRSVSTGATVKKGQMIGRVGSTGRSTGPHLHFEIRKNGTRQNPMSYVRKP